MEKIYRLFADQNLHVLLPIASELQMDGLLHRCEIFLIDNLTYPILEKLWLGDRWALLRRISTAILCL